MKIGAFLLSLFTLCSLQGQPLVDRADSIFQLPSLSSPQEAVLLVLGTNDIHGHFSKSFDFLNSNNPHELGGYDWFAAYVRAAKKAIEQQYASKGKVLLLDGGDAAQGTLLSNPSEGKFAAQVMSMVGYTAAVPGNHAYDFGPQGESSDQCPALSQNCDPLETIKLFQATSHFPFLSANVYIGDVAQQRLFYKPYTLIEFLGRNIAIVGIENEATPSTTYSENVSQLKFTDGVAEVKKISKELKEQNRADLVIVVMHEGDAANNKTLEAWINKLQENEDQPLVDAIVAGHSHIKNERIVKGIPYIQSYSGGQFFGAIALKLNQDPQTKN